MDRFASVKEFPLEDMDEADYNEGPVLDKEPVDKRKLLEEEIKHLNGTKVGEVVAKTIEGKECDGEGNSSQAEEVVEENLWAQFFTIEYEWMDKLGRCKIDGIVKTRKM